MAMDVLSQSNLVPTISYIDEIRDMMFGFGDSNRPRRETAELVEQLVHEQMVEILHRAQEVAERRGATQLGLEELVFLLRKHPVKVQRLLKYLSVRDTAAAVQALNGDAVPIETKRVKRCKDFLRRIDSNGCLLRAVNEELPDELRMERLRRLDRLSRDFDERKYAEFARARQVSFLNAKMKQMPRFHDWLVRGTSAWFHLKVDKAALEILSYFAYETIGHLVDMSLIVRKDSDYTHPEAGDPVYKAMPPLAVNPQYPMVQLKHDMPKGKALPEPGASEAAEDSSPLRKRLKSGGRDESASVAMDGALEPNHVMEAYRRLNQRPTLFAWFRQVDARHQPAESGVPIIVL
eukprot:snap_masked-scaffold416_size178335-processed-gene-0.20 protein:Tk04599 transcript:snap_masked-scaffold416_size178335-processed-gene-0.20-mRNA-1 annotation:"transcription initiation protein spt3 homolog"